MLGGGGHSKAQEIGQNSEKTIHNDLTYNKLDNNVKSSSINDIDNANNLKNIYAYNKVSSQNYNVNKQFTINNKTTNAQNITGIGFASECANTKIKANNGGNKMRNQDINNKTTNKIEKTSIGSNSGLFANTINIDNVSRKETQVLLKAETLQKRAGHIRTRINRRMSVGAQTTNILMRYTIQLVLWLFVFVLSTMIVYFTNAGNNNNLLNMQNNVIAQGVNTFADESTRKGTGTSENPFQISTYADLVAVANKVNGDDADAESYRTAHYKLMNDIETDTTTWTPIGSYTNSNYVFKGHFDGNEHTITFTQTVHITNESGDVYGGLFGYAKTATIQNLGINWAGDDVVIVNEVEYTGLVVSSSSNAAYGGGILGYVVVYTYPETVIENCSNEGNVSVISISNEAYAGGIAGGGYTTISNCDNTGSVSASTESTASTSGDISVCAGGIAGLNIARKISNCYNTGSVTTTSDEDEAYAGGILGSTSLDTGSPDTTIEKCNNTGLVSASSMSTSNSTSSTSAATGGLVGNAYRLRISDCSNTGLVIADNKSNSRYAYAYAGGIAGDIGLIRPTEPTVKNCYNTGAVTATSSDDAYAGGISASSGVIANSYNTGSVTATSSSSSSSSRAYAGGIVGVAFGAIINSYNTGTVTADSSSFYAGGITGKASSSTIISNCFSLVGSSSNAPSVSTGSNVGGIVGGGGTVNNCYYDYGNDNSKGTKIET